MSLSFPAGGSLYFTKELDKVATGLSIQLKDERFCIGLDTKLPLWYGRHQQTPKRLGASCSDVLARLGLKATALAWPEPALAF